MRGAKYFDEKVTVAIEVTALQDAAWMARAERSNRATGMPRFMSISDRSIAEIIAVCEAAFPLGAKEKEDV